MATWNGEDYVPDDDANTNQLPVHDSFHCGANNIHSQIEGLTTKTKKMTINSNDEFEGTTGNTHSQIENLLTELKQITFDNDDVFQSIASNAQSQIHGMITNTKQIGEVISKPQNSVNVTNEYIVDDEQDCEYQSAAEEISSSSESTDSDEESVEIKYMKQIKEENKKLSEETLCKVCLDEPMNRGFLPCGHYVACEDCTNRLRFCPICRQKIKALVKIYPVSVKMPDKIYRNIMKEKKMNFLDDPTKH